MENHKTLNEYQRSIINPTSYPNIKIPGTFGKQSITFHRQKQVTADIVGNDFCLELFLNEVTDSAGTGSTSSFVSTAYVAANTATSNVTVYPQDMRSLFNITADTAAEVRLVSGRVTVSSLSTTLNRTGSLNAAFVRMPAPAALAFGTRTKTLPGLPNVEGSMPIVADVASGQGVSIGYLPADEDDFQFLAPNTSVAQRHPLADDCIALVIIGQGLQTNSQVKILYEVCFEVIPTTGSSLAGLENFGSQKPSIPAIDVEMVSRYHRAKMLRVVDSTSSIHSLNVLNEKEMSERLTTNNRGKHDGKTKNKLRANANTGMIDKIKDAVNIVKNFLPDKNNGLGGLPRPSNVMKKISNYIKPYKNAQGKMLRGAKTDI